MKHVRQRGIALDEFPFKGYERIDEVMYGWNGRILRVNLSNGKTSVQTFDAEFALKYVGGRGFAIRLLWDELAPGVDPLGPDNRLIFAAGPLTGLLGPSLSKLVVAAKSPLTNGYGDGNVGSLAAVYLRKAGYDAIVVEGRARKPTYLYVEDEGVSLLSAEGLWGRTTFETERKLKEVHGKDIGVLTIGPGGENLVKMAVITSQEGRAGGRPGIGAVMGSKNLKALVIRGTKEVPLADLKAYRELIVEAYRDIKAKAGYEFWIRQGTMAIIEWSQENYVLPTYNFKEGSFDRYRCVDGYAMEAAKVERRGCPYCNMACGNVVLDSEGRSSELDYEGVAMLSSNVGIGHLGSVSILNRLADEYGLDTISLGNVLAFAMEATERGLLKDGVEWGDFKRAKALVEDTAYRRDLGALLAEGVMRISEKLKAGSEAWAMHVKGLEVSAYDCHTTPAMALSYATSPIGAHHKDAWIIAWEVRVDRLGYSKEKAAKVVELQRIRGGLFESIVSCRFPWVELGFSLEWYPRLLKAATGVNMPLEELLYSVADRIYALIRAFWVREYGGMWSSKLDVPPRRWFDEPLTKGHYAGLKLDEEKFNELLKGYYELRGWDGRGIPRRNTLERLGLADIANELEKYVKLKP